MASMEVGRRMVGDGRRRSATHITELDASAFHAAGSTLLAPPPLLSALTVAPMATTTARRWLARNKRTDDGGAGRMKDDGATDARIKWHGTKKIRTPVMYSKSSAN